MLYLWKHSVRHYRKSQEASRATTQQWIQHVRPWSSQVSIEENSKRVVVTENLQTHIKLKKARDHLGPATKSNDGTIVERHFEDEHYRCACTNKDTRNPTWRIWQKSKWKLDSRRSLQKLTQSRVTLSMRRQRYHKDKRTPKLYSGKGKNMTNQATQSDDEPWSSWSSWTWSLSLRSSWWDSSSAQTSRQSHKLTASDVWATWLDHKWNNSSPGDWFRNDSDSVVFFEFFYLLFELPIGGWQSELGLYTHSHTYFSAFFLYKRIIQRRQMDTTDTTGQQYDAHHIHPKQFVSCFSSCQFFISSMSKRAGESFASSASAKQKPVHCSGLAAKKINDRTAGRDRVRPRPT